MCGNYKNKIQGAGDFDQGYQSDDSTKGKECSIFVENTHYFSGQQHRDEAGAGARAARRVMTFE